MVAWAGIDGGWIERDILGVAEDPNFAGLTFRFAWIQVSA